MSLIDFPKVSFGRSKAQTSTQFPSRGVGFGSFSRSKSLWDLRRTNGSTIVLRPNQIASARAPASITRERWRCHEHVVDSSTHSFSSVPLGFRSSARLRRNSAKASAFSLGRVSERESRAYLESCATMTNCLLHVLASLASYAGLELARVIKSLVPAAGNLPQGGWKSPCIANYFCPTAFASMVKIIS